MVFLRSKPGLVVLGLTAAVVLFAGATLVQVRSAITPVRSGSSDFDFNSVHIAVEEVRFLSGDGVELSGWLLRGLEELPPIVLCHDLDGSKASLINLAIALRRSGFTVLLFDFRGHGDSGGVRSTLGLQEKRDVIGAVDFLARRGGVDVRRVGVFGVGMGAYAAVLAAGAEAGLRVLVLDGLYPDVEFALMRRTFDDFGAVGARLSFVPGSAFAFLAGENVRKQPAREMIGGLLGRDLLLLAPASDAALTEEMRRMYETIPEQSDVDGNLLVLPATIGDGLYGDDLARYHRHVAEFFESRLPRPAEGEAS